MTAQGDVKLAAHAVEFAMPWPLRGNPHVFAARDSAIRWMTEFGLLRDDRSIEDFADWRLAEVGGFFFPDADARQCALAAQMMGWSFLPFDDQLDGPLGRDPLRVARICTALIGIVHGEARGDATDSPTVRAFADLWGRMVQGASVTLLRRLRHHWAAYFSSQVTEAIDRVDGFRYADLDDYFRLRVASTCAFGRNDLGELWGGTEVPAVLWHHPLLEQMRHLAADLVALRNDSMSTTHEDVSGLHNAIFIIERERACDRERAVAVASRLAQAKVDRLIALEHHSVPRLLRRLDGAGQQAVLGYADILHHWIRGDYEWERLSGRHKQHRVLPEWATTLLAGTHGRAAGAGGSM
ncbi:hypothetical protein Are01nite_46640 [Actinoplanes regularis]|nr:hypothetical protein Are01nite_46640 [Actinoplanes regularis]